MNWFTNLFRSTSTRLHDTVDKLTELTHKQQDTIQQQATVIASPPVQAAVNVQPEATAMAASPYPKEIHDPDGGIYTAHSPAEEAQHAIDVARTQQINAQNAGPTLPAYTPTSIIPVPPTDDPYVVWCHQQSPNWDLIGAVNFFNAQPTEQTKWMFGTMRGSEPLTNWISLHFNPATVSPYINTYERMQPGAGNPRNPFFPV